jgi:hypothetical protein
MATPKDPKSPKTNDKTSQIDLDSDDASMPSVSRLLDRKTLFGGRPPAPAQKTTQLKPDPVLEDTQAGGLIDLSTAADAPESATSATVMRAEIGGVIDLSASSENDAPVLDLRPEAPAPLTENSDSLPPLSGEGSLELTLDSNSDDLLVIDSQASSDAASTESFSESSELAPSLSIEPSEDAAPLELVAASGSADLAYPQLDSSGDAVALPPGPTAGVRSASRRTLDAQGNPFASIPHRDPAIAENGKDPLNRGMNLLYKTGADRAVLLLQDGSFLVPQVGFGTPSDASRWSGMGWDTSWTPELWKSITKTGLHEVSPGAAAVGESKKLLPDSLRAAFGASDHEWLSLFQVESKEIGNGVLVVISRGSMQGALFQTRPFLAPRYNKALSSARKAA